MTCEAIEPRLLLHGGFVDPAYGDPTSGTGGRAFVPDPPLTPDQQAGPYGQGGAHVLRNADGSFLTLTTRGSVVSTDMAAIVTRFSADGRVDPTFGTNGQTLIRQLPGPSTGANSSGYALYRAPDGGYLVVGCTDVYRQSFSMFVARLTSAGQPAAAPYVTLPREWGKVAGVDQGADGTIYVVGTAAIEYGSSTYLPAVFRLTADGSPDATFGTGGKRLLTAGPYLPQNVFARAGGGFFVANVGALDAYDAAGQPDLTFSGDASLPGRFYNAIPDGAGGVFALRATTAPNGYGNVDLVDVDAAGGVGQVNRETLFDPRVSAFAGALVLAADGSFFIGANVNGEYIAHAAVVHLTAAGTSDPTFGIGGTFTDNALEVGTGRELPTNLSGLWVNDDGSLTTLDNVQVYTPVGQLSQYTSRVGLARVVTNSPIEPNLMLPAGPVDEGTTFPATVAPSLPPGVSVAAYAWDDDVAREFSATAVTPGITVNAGGGALVSPAVRLTLSNGVIITVGGRVAVRNLPPVVTGPIAPRSVLRGTNIEYGLNVTDVADPILNYVVNFGPETVSGTIPRVNGSVAYTYRVSGNFQATATVSDEAASVTTGFDVHVYDVQFNAWRDLGRDGVLGSEDTVLPGVRAVIDLNRNGTIDPGEPDAVSGTTLLFGQNLSAGDVQFIIVPTAGYAVIGGNIVHRTLPAGGAGIDLRPLLVDASEVVLPAFVDLDEDGAFSTQYESYLNYYLDLDGDARRDPDEPTSKLLSDGGRVPVLFADLPAGTYTLRLVNAQAINGYNGGQRLTLPTYALTFGALPAYTALGTVLIAPRRAYVNVVAFNDLNGDGVRTSDEPLMPRVFVHEDDADVGAFDDGIESFKDNATFIGGLQRGPVTLRAFTPAAFVPTTPTRASAFAYTNDDPTSDTVAFGFRGTDAAAPSVLDARIDATARPPVMRVTFSEDVRFSGTPDTWVALTNPAGQVVSLAAYADASYRYYDPASHVLTAALPTSALATDGTYAIRAQNFRDVANNAGVATTTSARFLRGDVNGDFAVDFADLLAVAQSYGVAGRPPTGGNVDFDPFGRVDFADLLLLAQQFGKALPGLQADADARPMASDAPAKSPRRRIVDDVVV